jgi:hypothetical protein
MGQRVNHDQGQYETRFGRKYREPLRIYSGPRYGNDHVNGRKRLWHGQTTCTKRQGQYETRLLDEYREVVAHNESGPRNGNEHPNGATLGKLHLSKKDWTHYDDATRIGPLKAWWTTPNYSGVRENYLAFGFGPWLIPHNCRLVGRGSNVWAWPKADMTPALFALYTIKRSIIERCRMTNQLTRDDLIFKQTRRVVRTRWKEGSKLLLIESKCTDEARKHHEMCKLL